MIGNKEREIAFSQYMQAFLMYAEGKYFSRRTDVCMVARILCDHENEVADKDMYYSKHLQIAKIWQIVGKLSLVFVDDKRPSPQETFSMMLGKHRSTLTSSSTQKDML